MSFETSLLPGEPIILMKLHSTFSVAKDTAASNASLLELLETANEPLYLVIDVTELKISFSDMVGGMATLTKGEMAVFKHPNLKQIVAVTTSDMIALGAKALGQSQYGEVMAKTFPTLDEALAYVRQAIAAG